MIDRAIETAWGHAVAFLDRSRRVNAVDLLVLLGIAGLFFGAARVAQEWQGPLRPAVSIDLSPGALPRYAFYSLSRAMLAYVLSLAGTNPPNPKPPQGVNSKGERAPETPTASK